MNGASYLLDIPKTSFITDANCRNIVPYDYIRSKNIQCYDKDGYELTKLEKYYYSAQGFKLKRFLNKQFLASPWIRIEDNNLYLEHCMLLNRCGFEGAARDQIDRMKSKCRLLNYLSLCRPKWGVDIAIDWIDDNQVIEILHLEYDSYQLDEAIGYKDQIEQFVLNNDLVDIANRIIEQKEQWCNLTGYHQNLWKAKYLGFDCSENTQKSI